MDNKLKLLVVDDEQIVLDSIKKQLRKEEDYEIYTFLSAQEAYDFVIQDSVDIILVDLMMPEFDGLEFIKKVRDIDTNIMMIMITGYATIKTALQAMQIGAFDYIAKPFTKEELKKIVRRAADLVKAHLESGKTEDIELESEKPGKIKGIGQNVWLMQQEDGNVLIGVERPFLVTAGSIRTIYLPSKGDELRQGSTFVQLFSSDLRPQALLAPLSGIVTEINQSVVDDPNTALQDPYGKGWLVKINPTNFEEEVKIIGR